MLKKHAKLAMSLGMEEKDIFIMQNGKVLELTGRTATLNGSVQSEASL